MDELMRKAYEKTALHRLGVPFERMVRIAEVRRALEASAARSRQSKDSEADRRETTTE